MLSLLACSLVLQVPVIQPPRLRTILSNGAVVLVQREPTAKKLSLQLFISDRTAPEQRGTHGLRHLLEHLEAKGRNHDLDLRLESHGAFLTAETLRDATVFTITLRPNDLKLGLEAAAEIMTLGAVSHEDIAHEAEIIRQEQALEETPDKVSMAAWSAAYGDDGLDPSGDADLIAHATPEQLAALHKKLFVGSNLVLVVSGDVDLDGTTSSASAVLSSAINEKPSDLPMRAGHGGEAIADGEGEGVGALVADFNSSQTAARLAAAFGIAAQIDDSFVTYTPSQRGGLILLGRTRTTSGLRSIIDGISPSSIFGVGRTLARQWVDRQIGPENDGYLRGLLLVQGTGVRPETMLQALDQMTVDDFKIAFEAFKSPNGVSVTGK